MRSKVISVGIVIIGAASFAVYRGVKKNTPPSATLSPTPSIVQGFLPEAESFISPTPSITLRVTLSPSPDSTPSIRLGTSSSPQASSGPSASVSNPPPPPPPPPPGF